MSDYLQYWKLEQVKVGKPLDYTASGQFAGVGLQAGDTLWIVTIREHRLKLVGPDVEQVCTRAEAEEQLRRHNLFGGLFTERPPLYALPLEATMQIAQEIDIHDLAADIRFNSPVNRLFIDTDGKIDGKQIQRLRRLTLSSEEMLEVRLGQQTAASRR